MMKFRRRHLLSGFLGLLSGAGTVRRGQAISAASSKNIDVSTVEEFFRAIGSNRTIGLTAQRYNVSELSSQLQWTNAFMREVHDGHELVISGVENLKIESLGKQPSLIVTEPRYASVLNFENCKNITISKIEVGHLPKKGFCFGGVLAFSNSETVLIENSVLYGSGDYGVIAEKSQNILIKNSVIKECFSGMLLLREMGKFTAENCRFYNNRCSLIIRISPGLISFQKCDFYNNYYDRYRDTFFNIDGFEVEGVKKSAPILVENCLIRNNIAASLTNNTSLVKLINTQLENNDFKTVPLTIPTLPPQPELPPSPNLLSPPDRLPPPPPGNL